MARIDNNRYGLDNLSEDHGQYQRQQWQEATKPNKQNLSLENGLTFVSQVSHYITQKKKKNGMLKGDKQQFIKETDDLNKYGGIKLAIKEQSDKLGDEIGDQRFRQAKAVGVALLPTCNCIFQYHKLQNYLF